MLRDRRERAGLSQREIAARVGISRQALNAIEGGRQSPSVHVALALGRVLGCRVEDLFAVPDSGVDVTVADGAATTRRAVVGYVGDRWVAHPVRASEYVATDGLLVGDSRVSLHGEPSRARRNVLVAGCAPLLETLARHAADRVSDARMRWIHAGSERALELLAAGHVHVAGIHYASDNACVVRERFAGVRMRLVNLIGWQQGLVVPRGNPLGITATDVDRPGLRAAWREPGASARVLLVSALGSASDGPPGPVVTGHVEVARAIATGAADVGVAIEPVAAAFGLDFVPLTSERFDLAFRAAGGDDARERLLDLVSSRGFRAEAGAFGGYSTEHTGHATDVEAA